MSKRPPLYLIKGGLTQQAERSGIYHLRERRAVAHPAVRASGMDRAREAVKSAIEPFRTAGGGYHMKNKFRYVIAQA
jgi:hypothetical protein